LNSFATYWICTKIFVLNAKHNPQKLFYNIYKYDI